MAEFTEYTFVQHKFFPEVGKMLLVKRLQNQAWYGVRYLAPNNILVYSEYHENELEPYKESENNNPDFAMINV